MKLGGFGLAVWREAGVGKQTTSVRFPRVQPVACSILGGRPATNLDVVNSLYYEVKCALLLLLSELVRNEQDCQP